MPGTIGIGMDGEVGIPVNGDLISTLTGGPCNSGVPQPKQNLASSVFAFPHTLH
jgi:hypothetical protein